jgi:cysteine desulfurase
MFSDEQEVRSEIAPTEITVKRARTRDFFLGIKFIGQEYRSVSPLDQTGSSVLCVVSITPNFQSEPRLHEAARIALPHIFEAAWPDPSKLGIDSKSAALLLNEARETFASHLGIRSDEINFLGEPNLGFHLGLSGLMSATKRLVYSKVDRMEIFAVSENHSSEMLSVSKTGQIDFSGLTASDVVSLQLCNRETGIIQSGRPENVSGLFIDATTSGTRIALPENWSTALWDSTSWAGPSGIGVFAVSKGADWKNPLPHLDGRINPGPTSLPLIVASALAIDSWVADEKNLAAKIAAINSDIRNYISSNIPDSDIAPGGADHLISASFLYVNAEQLVTALADKGYSVDSGSACSAANMQPSHVLAALGVLTQGNIRLTIHHATTFDDVKAFLEILSQTVSECRGAK